jgi:hypothetical protein
MVLDGHNGPGIAAELKEKYMLDMKLKIAEREKLNKCSWHCYGNFCKNDGFPFCEKHTTLKCFCGKQSTHGCNVARSCLVCGNSLCDDHDICER